MSTYNGEKYIREQIDSIFSQSYPDWNLIIRDDGSTDETVEIIRHYQKKIPEKITLIEDSLGNLGYKNSFILLTFCAKSKYIMFADQDDYWNTTMVEKLISEITLKEKNNSSIPLLVCSDLSICDDNLNTIHKSYFDHVHFDTNGKPESILLASHLHGCTFMFNQKLVEACHSIINKNDLLKNFIINGHDNFLSVLCAITGKIFYVKKSLVLHRIHDNNKEGTSVVRTKSPQLVLKIIFKYVFQNKQYREDVYREKIQENEEIINSVKKTNWSIPAPFLIFLDIKNFNYIKRKTINVKHPFVNFYSIIDRIIYIICF